MNIELVVVGKTDSKEVEALVEMYAKRVNRYCRFSITTLADVRNTRNMAPSRQKQLEGEAILKMVGDGDCLTLMDERGSQYTSIEFSQWLQKRMLSGVKRLVLVIGGPYGFSDEGYARADQKISLSKMTF
jgi:23S rRNA (pseudouridine1915-N3)-methyltransferase